MPGSTRARSFVPSSVPLGTVDCRDLPAEASQGVFVLYSHQGGLDGGI